LAQQRLLDCLHSERGRESREAISVGAAYIFFPATQPRSDETSRLAGARGQNELLNRFGPVRCWAEACTLSLAFPVAILMSLFWNIKTSFGMSPIVPPLASPSNTAGHRQ
jgi:hypothetical protein